MTFAAGIDSRYYVGSTRFSVFGRSLNAEVTCNQIETSSQEDRAQTYINGQKSGSASIDMMLDTDHATQFSLLNTWQTTPQPITVGFNNTATAGDIVWMMLGNQSSVTFGSTVSGMAETSVSVQPDGLVEWGRVLSPEAAVTTNTNGTAQNNLVPSTGGAVFHLHVTAFAGLTSDTITIQDSADNSSWSTIATFAAVTGVTSERLEITGTVRQYIRVVDTVVGTGSCTRMVARVRR